VWAPPPRRTLAVLRANLATAGVAGSAVVVGTTVSAFCADPRGGPFDLVLADPPYRAPHGAVAAELAALAGAGAIVPGGRIVLERDRRADEPPPAGFDHVRDRRYGDTVLRHLIHRQGAPPP
jgi:16S rRNA (guanine966-N2)-methyltransferase